MSHFFKKGQSLSAFSNKVGRASFWHGADEMAKRFALEEDEEEEEKEEGRVGSGCSTLESVNS